MSLLANIDHLAIAAGIEAVVVEATSREYRGDQSWHPVLDGALDLFKRTEEKSIRLVVGTHTIVVQREAGEAVGVVLPTGHAIAKSLRRMIRRMARKNRGPVAKAKPELGSSVMTPAVTPAAAGPTTTPPGSPPATAPGVSQSTPPSGGQLSVSPAAKPAEEAKPGANAGQASPQNTSDRGSFHGY